LKKLLEHNIKKRLSADGALEHPWIAKCTEKAAEEGEILNPEATRSAHKKITANKKTVSVEVEQLRNKKLLAIEEDFTKGIRHGQRLGETPKEDYMLKPEFVRRDNKITTAPSAELNKRRGSLAKLMDKVTGKKDEKPNPGGLGTIADEDEEDDVGEMKQSPAPPNPNTLRKGRSHSLMENGANPRRLSYLPGITKQDEQSFGRLYEEKSGLEELTGVVPSSDLPGATPEKPKAAEAPI
jgi:hypothetical protein